MERDTPSYLAQLQVASYWMEGGLNGARESATCKDPFLQVGNQGLASMLRGIEQGDSSTLDHALAHKARKKEPAKKQPEIVQREYLATPKESGGPP